MTQSEETTILAEIGGRAFHLMVWESIELIVDRDVILSDSSDYEIPLCDCEYCHEVFNDVMIVRLINLGGI